MATHSSVLAWRIPGTGEPGGLPSMGSDMTEATQQQLTAEGLDVSPHDSYSSLAETKLRYTDSKMRKNPWKMKHIF